LFAALAVLPLLALPAGGRQALQPVHVDDVVAGLLALVLSPDRRPTSPVIDMVGPSPLTLTAYLGQLRRALGFRKAAVVVPISERAFILAARVASAMGSRLVDVSSARMLLAGSAASSTGFARLLGREPRAAAAFIGNGDRPAALRDARFFWLLPLLRFAIAAVWLWTAAVSAGLYPVVQSLELLQAVGASPFFARVLLPGAVAFDLLLGLATLAAPARWRVRIVWPLQLALMVLYTAILSWKLPAFWLHPFGPLSKNLPMAAAIALLWTWDAAALRWRSPR
jgi:nitroreductase